jgi:hypothetical protein
MQLVGPKVSQNFHVQQTLGWTCFSYKDIIECLLFRNKGHKKKELEHIRVISKVP